MAKESPAFTLKVEGTKENCTKGCGGKNIEEGKIPVFSCEGACIKGEIARRTANVIAKKEPYRRACHGSFFAVPHSSVREWVQKAGKVIIVDGCTLRCHGRMLEGLIDKDNLVQFDALTFYKKYTDRFDMDSVTDDEMNEAVRQVVDGVLSKLSN